MGFLDSDSESDDNEDDSSLGSSSNSNTERTKQQVVAVTANTNGQSSVVVAKPTKPKPSWDDDCDSDDDSDDSDNDLIKLPTSKTTTISPKSVVEELAITTASPVVVEPQPQEEEEDEYDEEMEDNDDDDVPPPPERLYRETSTDWEETIAKVKRHTSRIKRGAENVRFVDPIVTERLEYSQYDHSVLSVNDEHHIAEHHDEIPWYEQDYQELPWYEQPDLEEDDALTALCKKVLLAGDDAEENKKHLDDYAQRVEAKVLGFALKLKHKTLHRLNSMSSQSSAGNSSHGGGSGSGSGGGSIDKHDMLLHQSANSFSKHNDSDIRGAAERFRVAQQQESAQDPHTENTTALQIESLPPVSIIAVETPPDVENGEFIHNNIMAQEAEKGGEEEDAYHQKLELESGENQKIEEEKAALEQQRLEEEAKRKKEDLDLAEQKRLDEEKVALEQQRLGETERKTTADQVAREQTQEEEEESRIEQAASVRQPNEKDEANTEEYQANAEEAFAGQPRSIDDDWNVVDLASDFILDLTDPLPEKQKELAARSKLEKESGAPARTMCCAGGNLATCLESFSLDSRPECFQLELPTQTSGDISGRMRQVAEILTRNSTLKTVCVLIPLKSCDDSTQHSDVSRMFEVIGSLKSLEDLSITSQSETIRSGIPTNVITCALRRISTRKHGLVSLSIKNLTLTESQAGFLDFAEALSLISGIATLKRAQVEVEFETS